jgi:hypothetical protein
MAKNIWELYKGLLEPARKEKWFDGWSYKWTPGDGLEWRMPNTVSGAHIIKFRKVSDPRIKQLSDWLDCALYALSKRQW